MNTPDNTPDTGIPDMWITTWLHAANRCPCPTTGAPCCVRRGLRAVHQLWTNPTTSPQTETRP